MSFIEKVYAQGWGAQPVPSGTQIGTGNLSTDVGTIVNWFLGFVGLVSVLFIVYGGMLYITSAGDPEKAGKGKTILMYAVIGIVIVALAWTIVNTVITNIVGG